MSYFMTSIGKKPDFSGIPEVEALPIKQAQPYLRQIASDLVGDGNEDELYFIHDGETSTSHNFVTEVELGIRMDGTFASTRLDKVIDACARAGNSFRIWWAHDGPKAYLEVEQCDTIDLVKKKIIEQVRQGNDIGVTYTPASM